MEKGRRNNLVMAEEFKAVAEPSPGVHHSIEFAFVSPFLSSTSGKYFLGW